MMNCVTHLWHIFLGFAILAPGYKFRGCQLEIPGYTRTARGWRGLSYAIQVQNQFKITQKRGSHTTFWLKLKINETHDASVERTLGSVSEVFTIDV